MLTRSFRISGALLPCGAMLALTAGCSSTLSNNEGVSASGRNEPSTADRHEVHKSTDSFNGTPRTAEPRTPIRADSSMTVSDDRTIGTPIATAEDDNSTATEQRDRVTIVTSKPPPPTRMETPLHEPRNGEFWVAGLWRGESGDYVWQAGRIEQDRTGQLYVPANWAASSRGWEYTPEFWR